MPSPEIIRRESSWHALTAADVAAAFAVDPSRGLAVAEATTRRSAAGRNELPRGRQARWWETLARQFRSPLVYLLVIAAGVTAWLQEWVDTTVILLSVAVNTVIGFGQEYQASHLLAKLKTVVRVEALVRRDGQPHAVDAEELVPGDVVELRTGSKVPADARLLAVHHLETGEAILTGESAPVKKSVDPVLPGAGLGDRSSMVWMGTTVEQGAGLALVVATGGQTEIGRLAALTMAAGDETTPLQERLGRLARAISVVVAVSAASVFVVGLLRHRPLAEVFTTAVAVAVSAIPEGLVAALSVVLAVSTSRILKQRGLVRRPVAAETLGSTTVICTDKTGTLTEGLMRVEQFLADGPERDGLLAMALANEAIVETRDGAVVTHGESTDRAKLEFALARGLTWGDLLATYPRRALRPFDSSLKFIVSVHGGAAGEGAPRCFVSGAAETLLDRSTCGGDGRALTAEERRRLTERHDALAAAGYRVIGLADRLVAEAVDGDDDAALAGLARDLTFRGLVAIRDPIRADVAATLAATRRAGLRVIMVTGDHRSTAVAIGRELGFRTGDDNVVSGATLDQMDDAELVRRINDIDVCVRVNPEHKLRLVRALKANDQCAVAMTGDGINDAPALKAADIGVAVGSATDVTKEAADLVLLDDGFTTIVSAIREGRIAFDNIKKVTVLLLSGSFTAFLLVMSSLVLGTPLPLSAVQILWANLVENGLPNFALAFEPAESDVMDRPPVPRQAPILDAAAKWIVFGVAVLRDCLLVGLFLWFYWYAGYGLGHVRTIVFAFLSTDSLFYIFSIKSFRQPLWREDFFDNWFLLGSIAVGFALVIAAVYLPSLNRFLDTVPLSLSDLAFVIGLAVFDIILIEIVKLAYRRRVDVPSLTAV